MMKTTLLKKIIGSTLFIIGLFGVTTETKAFWVFNDLDITYNVSNVQAPSVYAGPDQTWTLPISTATLSGTATDPDGTIVQTAWVFQSGPVAPTIASSGSLSTGVSGMNSVGTYVFTLSAQDNEGNWASDQMQIVINSLGGPSGTLSASSCGIATGASTCPSTVSWTTADLTVAATVITRDTGTPSFFAPSPLDSGSEVATLNYGTTTFSLEHNDVILAQAQAGAACGSMTASWNGSMCVEGGSGVTATLIANPISISSGGSSLLTWSSDGTSCTGTNFSTGFGSAPSGNTTVYPASTTLYSVDCSGPGGSGQASATVTVTGGGSYECSDSVDNDSDGVIDYPADPGCTGPTDDDETNGGGGGGGGFECSDGVDNADADILVDTLDPGCHSDGNAGNVASYDPNDDNETNKRKPIFIEF